MNNWNEFPWVLLGFYKVYTGFYWGLKGLYDATAVVTWRWTGGAGRRRGRCWCRGWATSGGRPRWRPRPRRRRDAASRPDGSAAPWRGATGRGGSAAPSAAPPARCPNWSAAPRTCSVEWFIRLALGFGLPVCQKVSVFLFWTWPKMGVFGIPSEISDISSFPSWLKIDFHLDGSHCWS